MVRAKALAALVSSAQCYLIHRSLGCTQGIMRRPFLSIAIVGCGIAGSAPAQTPSGSSVDTAAIRVVVSAAVEALAADGLIPVFPQPAEPWRIVAADSASPAWRSALTRLRVVLQARPMSPRDTSTRVLAFGPLRISADTLRGSYTISLEWRCRSNGVMHSSSAWRDVIAVRPKGWWERAQTVQTLIGDPPPCG